MLRLFHQSLENARTYSLAQLLGRPTIRRYQALVNQHVPQDPGRRVLEIGCGVGGARELFRGAYTGIDINPDYIEKARRRYGGSFSVMDAADIGFGPDTFDDAVSIATAHHLSDEQVASMVRKASNVAACLHIVDAILPVASFSPFKTALFRMDRGQHVRRFEELREIVSRNARLEAQQVLEGPLHDVCYFRATRLPAAAESH